MAHRCEFITVDSTVSALYSALQSKYRDSDAVSWMVLGVATTGASPLANMYHKFELP